MLSTGVLSRIFDPINLDLLANPLVTRWGSAKPDSGSKHIVSLSDMEIEGAISAKSFFEIISVFIPLDCIM